MNILVSINCTTYNHEKYIADAIESFLMQRTDFEFEILIGEDCSTDNTKKIVESYVEKHPEKIRLITSEQNVGARKNSMRLLNNSKGKFIAECEGDDFWKDPLKLQKQIDYLRENPDCTLCFHAAEIVKDSKNKTGRKVRPYNKSRKSSMEDIISGGGGFCATASLVYPKKNMMDPPPFYKTAHVGDYPMQLYLASQGYAYYFDDCMSAYRIGVQGSWTSRMNAKGEKKKNMKKMFQGDIELLVSFNSFTEFKYSSVVEKAILKKEYGLKILERDKGKNKKLEKYINKLSKKDRVKIYALCSFPQSYVKFAEVWDFILGKKLFN